MKIRKQIHYQFIITIVVMMFFSFGVYAQTGTLKGKVIDKETKEPIPFACIEVSKDSFLILRTNTDYDGDFVIDSLSKGIYNLKIAAIGLNTFYCNNIFIEEKKVINQTVYMISISGRCIYIEYTPWKTPLISKDPVPFGQSYTSGEINKMAW